MSRTRPLCHGHRCGGEQGGRLWHHHESFILSATDGVGKVGCQVLEASEGPCHPIGSDAPGEHDEATPQGENRTVGKSCASSIVTGSESHIFSPPQFLVDQRCMAARAPASRPQDILREEFWRVDPERTGLISVEQFLQVRLHLIIASWKICHECTSLPLNEPHNVWLILRIQLIRSGKLVCVS